MVSGWTWSISVFDTPHRVLSPLGSIELDIHRVVGFAFRWWNYDVNVRRRWAMITSSRWMQCVHVLLYVRASHFRVRWTASQCQQSESHQTSTAQNTIADCTRSGSNMSVRLVRFHSVCNPDALFRVAQTASHCRKSRRCHTSTSLWNQLVGSLCVRFLC